MLLSKVDCPHCGANFVAADAHVSIPRLRRRWWQLSSEQSEYRCPKCEAFCVMRVHPVALVLAVVCVAAATVAHLRGYVARGPAVAAAGTAVVMLLRFGLRPKRV